MSNISLLWEGSVEIGNQTSEMLLRQIGGMGGCVSYMAKRLLLSRFFKPFHTPVTIPVVIVESTKMIHWQTDFKDINNLFVDASNLNLYKCPIQVAPYLFIQHHQDLLEKIGDVYVAMDPIYGCLLKLTGHQYYSSSDPIHPGLTATHPPVDVETGSGPMSRCQTTTATLIPSRFVFMKGLV